MGQQFGDTTLTKVFVGGLAWETQMEALREHFERYGEILEVVIISDKISGRSKGYGFVTFKEADAAKLACEDATPVINRRRANCNLASLGAKRGGLRPSPPATPAPIPARAYHHPSGMAVGSRGVSSGPPPAQWYNPHTSGTPPPPPLSPFHLQQYHDGLLPLFASTGAYGYPTNYTADLVFNAKLGPAAGRGGCYYYYQRQLPFAAAQGQGGLVAAATNGMMPMYPLYRFHHHQSLGMGAAWPFYSHKFLFGHRCHGNHSHHHLLQAYCQLHSGHSPQPVWQWSKLKERAENHDNSLPAHLMKGSLIDSIKSWNYLIPLTLHHKDARYVINAIFV